MALAWRRISEGHEVAPIPGSNPASQYEIGRYFHSHDGGQRWWVRIRTGIPGGPLTLVKDGYVSIAGAKTGANYHYRKTGV